MKEFTLKKSEPVKNLLPQIAEHLNVSENILVQFLDDLTDHTEQIKPFFIKKGSEEERIMGQLITTYFTVEGVDCLGRPLFGVFSRFPMFLMMSMSPSSNGVFFLFSNTLFTELYECSEGFEDSLK